jgi:hypothetical protein
MFMFHQQNAGQKYNIKLDNKSFENVTELKYLQDTITNQNYMHKKLNCENVCYYSV